jgi:ABC-type antimicrobial peptide transport system permease subunit
MSRKKVVNPPQWPKRFFEWYCSEEVAEDLTGDMDEIFHQNARKMPAYKARLKYILQTLVLVFSYAVRNRRRKFRAEYDSPAYHSWAMYRSYSKIAFRSLIRQKAFSLINIVCLSVGMSVGLLALAVFVDVMEVDNYQTHADNIYRVTTTVDDKREKTTYASSSAPLGEQLSEGATGIREIVQMENNFSPEIVQGANISVPLQGYYVMPNFFRMFSFSLVEGNPEEALAKPFSIVITQSAAKKLFRDPHPLGKILEVKGLGNFEITGIIEDYQRSHLYFEVLTSYTTLLELERQGKIGSSLQDWGPVTSHYTYVMLDQEKRFSDFEPFFNRIASAQFEKDKSIQVAYGLQKLSDIPMSEHSNEIGLSWGKTSLIIFFLLALLVLLPACFNYTNIAIARALKRAKEIGLRKVSGGQSRHIFIQMVMETILLSVFSLTGATLIFLYAREPFLDLIVQGHSAFDLEITPATFIIFFLFAVLAGFMAGVFPAAYFSKLNPIETLRNASQSGSISKISIRKGLIVFQFALSLVFILSVAIIFKQYRYALNYDFGFQKENILDIQLKGVDPEVVRTTLGKLPEVSAVSMSSSIPGNWETSAVSVKKTGYPQDSLSVYQMFIDHNYIDNLQIKMIAGENFTPLAAHKEEFIIVNETFIRKFDLKSPHDALNQTFIVENGRELRISGVVKDFNYMPLREQINSFFFRYKPSEFRFANVKLISNDIQNSLARLEASWNTVSDARFEARFLDDELEASVVSFKSMIKIFGFLGLLAITISCLGLLAVIISSAESRTREMGIRKIFGASVRNLAFILSKGFLKLIAISIMIATPFTYIMFDKFFLNMFYYRANIGFAEISLSILLLFILVLLIIGSQSLKVARINPVETLKYE